MSDELLIREVLAVQREIARSRRLLDKELRELKHFPGLATSRTVQKLGGNGLLALLAGGAGWYFSKPQHVAQVAGALQPFWSKWRKSGQQSPASPASEARAGEAPPETGV